MPRLHVKSGPRAGEQIEVEQELVIGRLGGDLTIEDAELSARHLVIRPLDDALEVVDLGSANGTFVEGARIQEPTRLGPGAIIKLGTTVLEVELVVASEAPSAAEDIVDVKATRIHQVPFGAGPPSPGSVPAHGAVAHTAAPSSPQAPSDHAAAGAEVARQGTRAASAPPAETPSAPPRPATPAPSVGTFAPPTARRGRGLASRSWVPVALSFGSATVTALALVIYFVAR